MVLFEFNDVFARFTEAFQMQLGEPSMMTDDEYDLALKSIVKTPFYDELVHKASGLEVLKWAMAWGDKKVYLLLKNEKYSPSWVNQRKLLFMDVVCDSAGILRMEFDTCKTDADFLAHSGRGILVTGKVKNSMMWDATGNHSVLHADNAAATIQQIKNYSYKRDVALGLVSEDPMLVSE